MAGPGMKLPDVTVEASERDATGEPRPAAEVSTAVDECTPEVAVLSGEDEAQDQDEEDDGEGDDPIEIVDEMSVDGSAGVAVPDPFATFMTALEETAASLGAGPHQLACVRALFGVTRWDAIEPGPPAIEALVDAKIVVASEARRANGLSRGREFTEQVLAWQGILRGKSEDFTMCTALDEWAADVVARVMGTPIRAEGIRRELRRRGVAAFGLVADAA